MRSFHVGLSMRVSSIPFFRKAPFIRLLPGFLIGITVQYYFPHTTLWVYIFSFITISVLIYLQLLSVQLKFRFRKLTACLLYALFFCLGSLVTRERSIQYQKDWIGQYPANGYTMAIQLTDHPVERKKTWKATATILAIKQNKQWKKVSGKILLYFNKDITRLQKGLTIITRKTLQPITPIQNPGAFDYKAYCARQNIYHSIYLQQGDFTIAARGFTKKSWLQNTQWYIRSVFRNYIQGDQERAIAEALVIGYKYELDDDLLQAYSNTGVVHIIAISGMHLGLIYGILILLTRLLQNNYWIKWIRSLLIFLCIWSFTFLTGAGPSVLRAAVICSFLILGDALHRKTNTYNSLAASAFCLLLLNPFYVWDIGFQLSYMAVLSIVWIAGPLYRSIYFSFTPMQYLWQLMAVTLSAQVLTTPIILYHFHQFPNLFLITNLLIVPLSGLVLYGCLVLILLSKFTALATFFGKLIQQLLYGMNQCIFFFDEWVYAVTDHIQLNLWQVLLYYTAVVCIACRMLYKKTFWSYIAAVCLCIVTMFHSYRQINIRKSTKIVVYQVQGNTITDFSSGGNYISVFSKDSAIIAEKFIKPTRTLLGMLTQKANLVAAEQPVIRFGNRIIVFTGKIPFYPPAGPVDIVIIQKGTFWHMSDLHRVFRARQYVFDGNNSLWKIRKWKKEADSLHLRHHSVPEQGAFVMEL